MTDVVIRPLCAGEEELFLSMPDPTPVGHRGRLNPEFYAPQHLWVALRGDQVVARAAWAALPADPGTPVGLDWFDCEEPDLGARLLTTAQALLRDRRGRVPEYHLYLQPGWRERPAEYAAIRTRLDAAQLAGFELAGERIRTVWTAVNPLPPAPGGFAVSSLPVPEAIGLMPRFGRPDVQTGVEMAAANGVSLSEQPLFELIEHVAMAVRRGADLVGLALAGREAGSDSWGLGYLATIDDAAFLDLLVAVTAQMESQGAAEIYADTDTGGPQVLQALAAVGYRQVRSRVYLTPR